MMFIIDCFTVEKYEILVKVCGVGFLSTYESTGYEKDFMTHKKKKKFPDDVIWIYFLSHITVNFKKH